MGRCIFFRHLRETDTVQRSLRDQVQIVDNEWTANCDMQLACPTRSVPSIRAKTLSRANVIGAKLIGRAPEVPDEVRHTVKVGADGGIGEVATAPFLKHELTKLVHREPSFSASQATPLATIAGSATRGSVRRRTEFLMDGGVTAAFWFVDLAPK
jgi:hypothetical protein